MLQHSRLMHWSFLGGPRKEQCIGLAPLATPLAHQLLFSFDLLIYQRVFIFCFVFKCSEQYNSELS